MKSQNVRCWIALILLSLLGLAAGLCLNRFGVDVEPDSAVMIAAGLRCAHGEGVSIPNMVGAAKPMTWFPPMISWGVAGCEWAGLNYRQLFGVFNAVAWGLLIGWVGWLARRTAGNNALAGLFAAGVLVTSSAMCAVCGMLYSEPPFWLWMTGALAALGCWWERPLWRWAALAGVCVGGALLTRYVGLTLVALGGLAMLVRPGQKWGRRLAASALFGILSAGPMFAWHFWQTKMRHGDGARTLAWHPIPQKLMEEGIATFASFIVPAQYADSVFGSRAIFGLACLLVCGALFWLARRGGGTLRDRLAAVPGLVKVCTVFVGIYLSFLVVSISIADADTPLDGRILSILIPPGALLASYLCAVTVWEHGNRWARQGVTAVLGGLLLLQGMAAARLVLDRQGVLWGAGATSPLLDALGAIPSDAVIYSNDPYAIYMAVRRKTETLPFALPSGPPTPREREDFRAQMEEMRAALAGKGGWVVYWNALRFLDPVIDQDELKTAVRVVEARASEDGTLLRVAPGTPQP